MSSSSSSILLLSNKLELVLLIVSCEGIAINITIAIDIVELVGACWN
jgi:hypothetical protein